MANLDDIELISVSTLAKATGRSKTYAREMIKNNKRLKGFQDVNSGEWFCRKINLIRVIEEAEQTRSIQMSYAIAGKSLDEFYSEFYKRMDKDLLQIYLLLDELEGFINGSN